MSKLKKLGAAVVFSLFLSMAIFATGAFAQSAEQNAAHSKISVSARTAVLNSVARGVAANMLGANGWGDGWDGGFDGLSRPTVRCTSTRVCRSVRECSSGRWGRFCHNVRICQSIRNCLRCRDGFGFGGFDSAFAVRHSLGR